MTLTLGSAPFAPSRAGALNFSYEAPKHILYVHDEPTRIRAELAGRTVLDTTSAKLLHETAILPQVYVPLDDVDRSLLEETEHSTHCPFKGDASYWTLRVGDQVRENALWTYPEPIDDDAPDLSGLVGSYWDAFDTWWAEDERMHGHVRDPYHRIDTRASSRLVEVVHDGATLAETRRAIALRETGLPVVWYLPAADVRTDLLSPSATRTVCAYKGFATYHSLDDVDDVAWQYDDVLSDGVAVRGRIAFDTSKVEVRVDGRPV